MLPGKERRKRARPVPKPGTVSRFALQRVKDRATKILAHRDAERAGITKDREEHVAPRRP